MLLTGCNMSPTDSEIQQKLAGTWIDDSDAESTFENKANGSFVVWRGNTVTAEGTWHVKGGFMIGAYTNASATVQLASHKVVSIGRNKLIVLDARGGTNEFRFHRK
jgi:hypothetical protein